MKTNLEERIGAAVTEVEQADTQLARELHDVRARRWEKESAPNLESLTRGLEVDVDALTRETIVLRTGRPVLLVRNDAAQLDFHDAESEVWRTRLNRARELLGRAIPAVGRIEVEGHDLDWVGTGWLVQPDVIVTNRHVAIEFARRSGDRFVFRQGYGGTMSARVDFLEEYGQTQKREFAASEVLYIEDDSGPDVAFLRVRQTDGDLATPISLSQRSVRRDQQVAVIGYPARDSRILEQDLMLRIFGEVFDKKRLAPGQIKAVENGLVLHDCSTLGGNSGSAVIDLESGDAVALHFSGRFLRANYAVPASTVAALLESYPERRRPQPTPRTERGASQVVAASTGGTTITVPLHIRIELGEPAADVTLTAGRATAASNPADHDDDAHDPEGESIEEGRPEEYADREGYAPDFLGIEIPLPDVHDDGDVLSFRYDGRKMRELKYQHFSVVMSERRRLCHYSAVNIDGKRSGKAKRTSWQIDPRIPHEAQTIRNVYGNEPKFSRGHMTRREDPIWGSERVAARGNRDSMHLTNAVPQMQPFNAGIWLALENYALENAREDDMKIAVITGPVFRKNDPIKYGVRVPVTFWKVIAFIHDDTGEPCATGYTMSQTGFLREEEFVFGRHETAQVPISVVERMAGVSFTEELRRLDPLERVSESRPRRLRSPSEIRFR